MMSIADTSTASRDERPADALSLSKQWNSIDWTKAERCIRHIQGRISKAYSEGITSLAKFSSPFKPPSNNGLLLA